MSVITISRQYGSGGDEIAAQVCEILGYRYFDKRLIAQLVSDLAMSEIKMEDFSEDDYQVRNILERLFGTSRRTSAQIRAWIQDIEGKRQLEVQHLDEEHLISLIRDAIQMVYRQDNIVIVGRGGQAILKDQPNVLHVRIEALFEARVQYLRKREDLTLEDAQQKLIQKDKAAADYLKRFYDIDWEDPKHYHLVINTGKCHIIDAVKLLANAVEILLVEEALSPI
jgi:cytidylate kinase